MAGQYQYLFTPIRVGQTIIPNRIVFAAHLTNLAEENLPGPRLSAYYAERARGGCGLIITEEQSVHPSDWAYQKLIHGFDPHVIPHYRRMTRAVHDYGTRMFAQINHNGMQASSIYSRRPVVGPSSMVDPIHREMCKELEQEEIAEIVRGYALVARHVREGDFDGAELQSSHSSLMRQFFSPYYNRRSDAYGGSLENRVRFALEVIEAVRAEVGRDFTLGIRLCGDELIPAGLTLDDVCEIARRLEATGQLDFINTSIGEFHNLYMVEGSMHTPPGYQLFVSASIRETVKLPVFCTGRIKDPVQAERILREGLADMVDVVRGQICDPDFTRKAREGRAESIRLCISCNQYCIGRMGLNLSLGCIQTPATGNELQFATIAHTDESREQKPRTHRPRVMVVGGGPAGMQAAKVAAQRGYHVWLYERQEELGGQINLIVRAPGRVEFGDASRNLQREIQQAGVDVHLGVEVTAEMIEREQPDAVIIATGSYPSLPPLPGIDLPHVATVWQVLQGEKSAQPGEFVLVYDTIGFHQATSTAEWLAERGCQIEVVTPQFYVGGDLGITLDIELWYRRVLAKGARLTANHFLASLERGSATIVNNYTGQSRQIEQLALVVMATPQVANDSLYRQLQGRVKELYRVGDCVAPRRVEHAILDGERVARALG
ncbi:MAG TPA: mycofactocin system FadH/OYE family oxidoreductase 2 [Ktedonobacteraceae bacterium]|jgi:mycofactocin system FadH/OYE family oxidoreductase 2|nr:mycofactocin system FadH/OYE family oxidoreductase 2 [Ktedonobacteraceae bacterium]